ncbi:ArsR family transcriptional regulator [Halobaculum sp. CBA1158]|uniref:ArsR family transcriptional regulator n=1 Tax=Halobaculum sp. CBA1158 TaxID=2904243 RepID=UPI001F4728A6|nr:ArsR family transcriptional regulator [Halobaculum sp. CBA1158]UIP00323.1 ArsR family transcriptional regulator [Halobaculum sp. CBA1158]
MDGAQSIDEMDADDLTRTDRAILDVLKEGRGGDEPWGIATKGRLVDETDFSRNSVYNRLEILQAAGHVKLIHEGTREFKFVDDPREEVDDE